MKIGMIQLLVEGGEPFRNVERSAKLIKEAKDLKCNLVVLPETLDYGWTHPSSLSEAKEHKDFVINTFRNLAIENKIYICFGYTNNKNGKNFNSSMMINDSGEIILEYDKINLLEVEAPFYEPGKTLSVVGTEFGNIGINICSDNYFKSISLGRSLGQMGADLIISPCSWTVDHEVTEEDDPYLDKWKEPLLKLCKECSYTMITTTSVGYIVGGPYEGKKMIGCSLAVGPEGILLEAKKNEFSSSISTIDINLNKERLIGCRFSERINI